MSTSICPFCHLTVPSLEIERHANNHFEDEQLATDIELAKELSLASSISSHIQVDLETPFDTHCSKNLASNSSRCDDETSNVIDSIIAEKFSYLVNIQIKETFYKVNDGLVSLLKNSLELDSENSISILSGYVDHFQSVKFEDVGWGCGYRNIQMLSSHLLHQRQEVNPVLFGGCRFVPDIASIQRWLEIAWERGFDPLGSNHFDKEICGKRNWIGTTECAALFRSFGVRARIVDFGSKESDVGSTGNGGKRKAPRVYGPMDKFLYRRDSDHISEVGPSGVPSETAMNHNRAVKGQQILIDWVWNYFSNGNISKSGQRRVVVSEKAPLYFQHDGHSRTIVGIQVKRQQNGIQQYNLLILDPGHKTEALEESLRKNMGWQKFIKRGVHTLKKPQYQLCYIEHGIAGTAEMEKLKILDSIYHEF